MVGSIAALLIVVGLIAFLVMRNCRQRNNTQPPTNNVSGRSDVTMAPVVTDSSQHYGNINIRMPIGSDNIYEIGTIEHI